MSERRREKVERRDSSRRRERWRGAQAYIGPISYKQQKSDRSVWGKKKTGLAESSRRRQKKASSQAAVIREGRLQTGRRALEKKAQKFCTGKKGKGNSRAYAGVSPLCPQRRKGSIARAFDFEKKP